LADATGVIAALAPASGDFRYHAQTHGLPATKACRVLVVDDDPMVRKHLAEVLKASQFLVEVAATGEEALRIMDTAHCHVVLTDGRCPIWMAWHCAGACA
jgi:PleD family two-component response regulator